MNALFLTLLVAAGYTTAQAQASHLGGTDPSRTLYREANTPAASLRTRAATNQHSTEFLNKGTYEAGYLRPLDGRRVLVLGLRYHVGQRVVQVQDSMQADSTHYWPLAAVRGFDLGTEDDIPPAGSPGAAPGVRRYRARLVQEGRQGTRREAVEVLTSIDSGPLLLAWLPVAAAPAGLTQVLVAGPGTVTTEPLRPLELTEAAVLRLCGSRATEVRTFATGRHLRFDQPTEVAKILDYYNRVAVAK
ncbi:hypothetical protein GKZ68_15050 [Hymenobacter sp. BRD128]|uniref:hypothetical protein n=1 Tax=Hymenobacter sp. BRD128 TaxID=2675878 RepID=UPI0015640E65|nr:hypothetical protein [Hymenobacter sp. BRD128]QKG57827.1 hypothetical protein GKZ68_15050 [Hymenobacter sp. BRD128]